jgi:colanic acid/amylovoran biosynthesis glycosyltransferase
VTDVGGMRELIEPEVDALMVPAQDPVALAAAMQRILGDAALARRLSQRSRQKVAREFHHRRGAEALAACLGIESESSSPGVGQPERLPHVNGVTL